VNAEQSTVTIDQAVEPVTDAATSGRKKPNGRRADRRSEGRLLVAGRFYNASDYVIAEQRRRSTHR
jgi:hypothetical protein